MTINIYLSLDNLSLKSEGKGVPVLANDSQLECLKNRGYDPLAPLVTKEVYGPESFNNIKVSYFDLSNNPKGFEYEFSNCFYDSIIPDVNINELDVALGLIEHLGNGNYYFYKSPQNETVTIYVKKKT